MNRIRAIVAIGCVLLATAVTGCQAGACGSRRGLPIEYRVFDDDDSHRCPGCAACGDRACDNVTCANVTCDVAGAACDSADDWPSAEAVEVPIADEVLTPFAGLGHLPAREPAIPPPHPPWFYAIPTMPIFPLADDAISPAVGPYLPPVPGSHPQPPEYVPAPMHEIPPPAAQPSASAALDRGAPMRLPEHRPGPWVFRPARNHATDHEQRSVQRVISDTAARPRKPSPF
jgi:hypothetical protein